MNTVAASNASTSPQVRPASGYAGDIPVQLAYQWMQSGEAVLVDVRTDAEREWVGYVPGAIALAWKQWPGMAMNPHFDEGLKSAVPPGKKAVLLCRSGVRSIAAVEGVKDCHIAGRSDLENGSHAVRATLLSCPIEASITPLDQPGVRKGRLGEELMKHLILLALCQAHKKGYRNYGH